jgi:hypothetical protein
MFLIKNDHKIIQKLKRALFGDKGTSEKPGFSEGFLGSGNIEPNSLYYKKISENLSRIFFNLRF